MLIEFDGLSRLADGVTCEALNWDRVVWGGYGRGNTGDYLTLAVALQDACAVWGDSVRVLAPDDAELRDALPKARTVVYAKPRGLPRQLGTLALRGGCARLGMLFYRWGIRRPGGASSGSTWLKVMRQARSFHLVGGGYLTDRFDLEHFLCPLRVAVALRLPVTTSPLGLGPFVGRRAAAKVAAALRTARVVVRDEASLRFCRDHGLAAEEQPDDGFRLREVVPIQPPESERRQGGRRLGICIFSQYDPDGSPALEAWWVACLRHLVCALPGWQCEGFCFHTSRDMEFDTMQRLFARAGLDPDAVRAPEPDFRKAVAALQQYDAIVSTRFHAVVAAAVLGIPCVAMAVNDYYEIKMRCAARHSRLPLPVLNPANAAPEAVAGWLQSLPAVARAPQPRSLP